jgi:hypothetical protein
MEEIHISICKDIFVRRLNSIPFNRLLIKLLLCMIEDGAFIGIIMKSDIQLNSGNFSFDIDIPNKILTLSKTLCRCIGNCYMERESNCLCIYCHNDDYSNFQNILLENVLKMYGNELIYDGGNKWKNITIPLIRMNISNIKLTHIVFAYGITNSNENEKSMLSFFHLLNKNYFKYDNTVESLGGYNSAITNFERISTRPEILNYVIKNIKRL